MPRLHILEAFNLANTVHPSDQLRLLSLMVNVKYKILGHVKSIPKHKQ